MSGLQQAQCRSKHRQGDRQSHCCRYRTLDTKCLHITTWQIDTCSSQVRVLGRCYRFVSSYVSCHWVVLSVASAVCCPPIWLIPQPHTPTHTPHDRSHLKQHTHTPSWTTHTVPPPFWPLVSSQIAMSQWEKHHGRFSLLSEADFCLFSLGHPFASSPLFCPPASVSPTIIFWILPLPRRVEVREMLCMPSFVSLHNWRQYAYLLCQWTFDAKRVLNVAELQHNPTHYIWTM